MQKMVPTPTAVAVAAQSGRILTAPKLDETLLAAIYAKLHAIIRNPLPHPNW